MHPILLHIPGTDLFVSSHLAMTSIAFFLGGLLLVRLGRRYDISDSQLFSLAAIVMLGVYAGGRSLDWVVLRHLIPGHGKIKMMGQGWVLYGGFIGAVILGGLYALWRRIPLFVALNISAPVFGLGVCIGRIGCFLNGCDFGRPTDLPWGVRYPHYIDGFGATAVATLHRMKKLIPVYTDSLPVHPTQLYESALGLGLLVLALCLLRRRPTNSLPFWIVVGLYSCGRFFLEFLRDDIGRGVVGTFSTSQAISLVLFPLAVFMIGWISLSPILTSWRDRDLGRDAGATGLVPS